MMELNATAEAEKQAQVGFDAGFDETPPPAVKPVEKAVETPKIEPAPKPVVAEAPKADVPEFVQLTKQELDNLKAAAGKTADLESRLSKVLGTMGNAQQIAAQIVAKAQAETPAGVNVEFSDEDFAELAENFPELAKFTRTSLERLFKKASVRGTGTAAPAVLDDDAVEKAVERSLIKKEQASLEKAHPTWKDIVGAVDTTKGETPSADNKFRKWLAAQPADYQKEIDETDSPSVVQAAIDAFIASEKPPAPAVASSKPSARRAIIEAAVQPKGDGVLPVNTVKTEQDAFDEGYRDG